MLKLRACVVVLVAIGIAATVPVVNAQEPIDPTVIVLDGSEQMFQSDTDRGSRMTAAKESLNAFLNELPPESLVGFIAYGTNEVALPSKKGSGCNDVTMLSPPGVKPPSTLYADLEPLQAKGFAPIGRSLERANEVLPHEGNRSIVLIASGADTCSPPPACGVAKQLKDQNQDLVIHTIGFMADDAARAELSCIANVAGGTYEDTVTKEQIHDALRRATARTSEGYQFPKQSIHARPNALNAPIIPVGTLQDPKRVTLKTMGEKGEQTSAFNRFKVYIPRGHNLHIGALNIPDVGGAAVPNVTLYIRTSEHEVCSFKDWVSELSVDQRAGPRPWYLITSDTMSENCYDDELVIEFQNYRGIGFDHAMNIDAVIAAVPQPTNTGDWINTYPPKPRDTSALPPPLPASEPQAITPARNPTDVPMLEGTTIQEISPGETHYYSVPVQWGQVLNGTIESLEDTNSDEPDQPISNYRKLHAQVFNPLNEAVALVGANNISTQDVHQPAVFGTKAPISFGNQDQLSADISSSWLGGNHIVGITYTNLKHPQSQPGPKPVQYRLTLQPEGAVVQGPEIPDSLATAPDSNNLTPGQNEETLAHYLKWFLYLSIGISVLGAAAMGVVIRRRG